VIGVPPSERGAVHETVIRLSAGRVETVAGSPGATGVGPDGAEDSPTPTSFDATTVKV
jgi:hypothetical protein